MSATYDCADHKQRTTGLERAAASIKRGELVVLPTDTVYGVGADAFTPTAVESLLTAKGRGRDMPVPVLIGSVRTVEGLASRLTKPARDLMEAFWPGALTVVVRHHASLAWDLGDTSGTVAVRMPLHPVALELLRLTGPLAVSSANRSGEPPATTMMDAQRQLGERVAVYLDGGECAQPVPSSIVDLSGDTPVLLRSGAIELDALRTVLPDLAEAGS